VIMIARLHAMYQRSRKVLTLRGELIMSMWFLFFHQGFRMLVFWLSLVSRSVSSFRHSQWTYIPWTLRFILFSLRYSRSCRCLC
ncbi:hypothetical protein DFJ58DRAFT_784512, partial [Suillus subalutaceus]|uniref:uncharacterized protein n=1 Tax=Suillus subalutaceus TaxID=48586 RepID=UPI001B865E31